MTAEYLRPGEAARFLGIGRTSFWRLRKKHADFPRPRRFAGRDRFKRSELVRWADSRPPAMSD